MTRSMGRLAVLTACLVLVGATLAQAAVIGTTALVREPPTTPFSNVAGTNDALLGAPWVGYTLGLVTNAGELIGGVDVSIGGTFHQRWTPGEDDDGNPILLSTPNSGSATNADSHLRPVSGFLPAAGPAEDNSLAGSPLADTAQAAYGIGSYLSGIWGIPGASQTTSTNLAYIVIPRGSEVSTDIRVKVADPGGNIIGELTSANFPGFEPQTNNPPLITDADLGMVMLDTGNPPALTNIMHQFLVVDDQPINQLTWSLDSINYVGSGAGILNAPTLDANGKLSWIADGSSAGQYTFNVKATDAGPGTPLSDVGFVTVNLKVPEPASLALFGLALVGFAAFRRK